MKIAARILKFKNNLIKFIHLQLFITLISIPVLLCWGMPISLLTFAGNFLLSPILTAFLLFSSLIFFCQMLHIPNGIFIFCLEHITHWWLKFMKLANAQFLLGLSQPSIILLLAIPIAAALILHHKKINTAYKGIACYGIFMIMILGYLHWYGKPVISIDTLDCNKGKITIVNAHNQIVIIDPGVIGRRLSAPSWCEYTLMPFLVKKYGSTTIDHLVLLQPNKIIFDAILSLQEKIIIKNLYIPVWEGPLPKYWWSSFFKLKDACTDKQCKLIRLGASTREIILSDHDQLSIKALPEQLQSNEFTYPAFHVHAQVDNQIVEIYSSKMKHSSS